MRSGFLLAEMQLQPAFVGLNLARGLWLEGALRN